VKRLMIATALLLTTAGVSVWAQAPTADADKTPQAATPAQTMPMANCPGISGGATADAKTGCPMAPGDKSADQDTTPMHRMMHGGMMRGHMHPDDQEGKGCCELSKADKPK